MGALPPFWGRGAGSLSNIIRPGLRPTCVPSFILIRPTVWPQYTNVTDRQDRQIETVAQKSPLASSFHDPSTDFRGKEHRDVSFGSPTSISSPLVYHSITVSVSSLHKVQQPMIDTRQAAFSVPLAVLRTERQLPDDVHTT